jgi:hypothetical protein
MMKKRIDYNTRVIEKMDPANEYLFLKYHLNSDIIAPMSVIQATHPTKDINKIHVTAWKLGLKSLYYQHSMNAAQKFKQKKSCESCEG